MRTNKLILLALSALTLAACTKDAGQEDEITAPISALARVKFFHFGVNGPGVNFFANDTKMTAITSGTGAESTTGTAFGGAGAGGLYTAVQPGQYTLSGRIAAATDKNLAIVNLPTTLTAEKLYSFFLSGVYNTTTKAQDAFIIEDVLPPLDRAVACVRFVNAIFNSTAQTLFVKHTVTLQETQIGNAVAYKAGGTFTCVPAGFYDLNTRNTGSTANAITRTGVSFLAGRAYTIASRGDMTVGGTTAAQRPQLDNTANR